MTSLADSWQCKTNKRLVETLIFREPRGCIWFHNRAQSIQSTKCKPTDPECPSACSPLTHGSTLRTTVKLEFKNNSLGGDKIYRIFWIAWTAEGQKLLNGSALGQILENKKQNKVEIFQFSECTATKTFQRYQKIEKALSWTQIFNASSQLPKF